MEIEECDGKSVVLADLCAADAYALQHPIDVTALGLLVGRRLIIGARVARLQGRAPGRPSRGAAVPPRDGSAAVRHRQAGDPRIDPEQAGQAVRRGVGDHQDPPEGGREAGARHRRLVPAGPGLRAAPPRALGRHRLSRGQGLDPRSTRWLGSPPLPTSTTRSPPSACSRRRSRPIWAFRPSWPAPARSSIPTIIDVFSRRVAPFPPGVEVELDRRPPRGRRERLRACARPPRSPRDQRPGGPGRHLADRGSEHPDRRLEPRSGRRAPLRPRSPVRANLRAPTRPVFGSSFPKPRSIQLVVPRP